MASCCNGKCDNSKSHLGFFVAMLAVVAIGGGVYLYLDKTVFTPNELQQQTAAANPGTPHPPKDKMPGAKDAKPDGRPEAAATTDGK